MTKEKQNNIPKAKYPWVWECESRTLIFGELAIAAFLAFLLTSAHAALIQMEVCVVLLPIVIHLLMRAMTFAGLYDVLKMAIRYVTLDFSRHTIVVEAGRAS